MSKYKFAPKTVLNTNAEYLKLRKKLKDEMIEETTRQIMTLLLSLPLLVAEKYEWSQEDKEQFANDILEEYRDFQSGELSLEQLRAYTYNTVGIKFVTEEEL